MQAEAVAGAATTLFHSEVAFVCLVVLVTALSVMIVRLVTYHVKQLNGRIDGFGARADVLVTQLHVRMTERLTEHDELIRKVSPAASDLEVKFGIVIEHFKHVSDAYDKACDRVIELNATVAGYEREVQSLRGYCMELSDRIRALSKAEKSGQVKGANMGTFDPQGGVQP